MMKKCFVLIAALVMAGNLFAQEYTILYGGAVKGIVTITKDAQGRVVIKLAGMEVDSDKLGHYTVTIDNAVCPLLPKGDSFGIYYERNGEVRIEIAGNTTTTTYSDGGWSKTVVAGNTTTTTFSYGYWWKTVVDGNITIETHSDGSWYKTVVAGNTTTKTSSSGYNVRETTVVDGNTTTTTTNVGTWEKTVVEGNTTTVTDSLRWRKTVVDKQGRTIFVEITGDWNKKQ